MPGVSTLEAPKNHGIPVRAPASTSLWAHLLRKDTRIQDTQGLASSNPGITLPPISPLDKNGTSMRILLHDTQAHLDKFSVSADKLLAGVDEAAREISMVNTLFQRANEALTDEMVDLVNRSQTQLQATIGTPAQAGQLERLSKEMTIHLEATEKRLDAIQILTQTHSQMLQIQSQALQSLQEQHGTILAALLPLLPLLQAIPLHIDVARNHLSELLTVPTVPPPSCHGSSDYQTKSTASMSQRSHRKKRSSSTLSPGTSPFSSSTRKKARGPPIIDAIGSSGIRNAPVFTPTAAPRTNRKEFGSSLHGIAPFVPDPSPRTRSETIVVPSPPPEIFSTGGPDRTNEDIWNGLCPPTEQQPQDARLVPVLSQTTFPQSHPVTYPSSATSTNPSPLLGRSYVIETHNRTVDPGLVTQNEFGNTTPHSELQVPMGVDSADSSNRTMLPLSAVIGPTPTRHSSMISPCNPASRSSLDPPFVSKSMHPQASASFRLRLSRKKSSSSSGDKPPTMIPPSISPVLFLQAKARERRSPLREGRRFIPLDDSDSDENGSD